nr:HK97 gp10 family phage protein [uncultured Acinetobacter sp.]
MAWKGKIPTDFAIQVNQDSKKLIQDIAMDTVQGLMVSSPVMDGTYRASHIVSINSPSYSINNSSSAAPKGSIDPKAFSDAARAIVPLKPGDVVYVQNNLPYAERLENGHSMQAAEGVYGVVYNYIVQKYGG